MGRSYAILTLLTHDSTKPIAGKEQHCLFINSIKQINYDYFFGFAIADSMFPTTCNVSRKPLTMDEFVDELSAGVTSCCNASHGATAGALNAILAERAVSVEIPETPPMVKLEPGDSVIVMSVRGLPRLTDNRHFTEEEIAGATFVFAKWTVTE